MKEMRDDPRIVGLRFKKSRIEGLTKEYKEEYFSVLRSILCELKLDGAVVRKRDGVAGEIAIECSAQFPVQFHPYTKDGSLSKNASGYISNCSIEATIECVLEHYEPKSKD